MQRLMILTVLSFMSLSFIVEAQTAKFDYFSYKGNDAWYDKDINRKKEFYNPIIAGFYPDPSVCRKGDDFYLVNSSFSYYPGIPLFHSKDLVNWKQLGHVLDRPSQLNLDGLDISSGIFAPVIEYNKFNNMFYVVTTNVGGIGNFLVKTDDLSKGWSDPILLPQVIGIDPSLFVDEDGAAYIVHNGDAKGTPRWEGHRAIWIHRYDTDKDEIVGEPTLIIDGGVNLNEHPIWIEGPHIYKKDGFYYLMAAEGGTREGHSEVVFRSKNVMGPYVAAPQNPILTQRDLSPNRKDKISSTGHADMIEDIDGSWWSIFLGCRPYADDFYNTGRETFLLPVSWIDGYPMILDSGKSIPKIVAKNNLSPNEIPINGNYELIDEFKDEKLSFHWNQIRTPRSNWYRLKDGLLHIDALDATIWSKEQPAFIGRRQQHTSFDVSTKFLFDVSSENDLAGLVCFQNEDNNVIFGKTMRNGKLVVSLIKTENGNNTILENLKIPKAYFNEPLCIRVKGNENAYEFFVAYEANQWIPLATTIKSSLLSTAHAGGFVGTYVGMYATQNAK